MEYNILKNLLQLLQSENQVQWAEKRLQELF